MKLERIATNLERDMLCPHVEAMVWAGVGWFWGHRIYFEGWQKGRTWTRARRMETLVEKKSWRWNEERTASNKLKETTCVSLIWFVAKWTCVKHGPSTLKTEKWDTRLNFLSDEIDDMCYSCLNLEENNPAYQLMHRVILQLMMSSQATYYYELWNYGVSE